MTDHLPGCAALRCVDRFSTVRCDLEEEFHPEAGHKFLAGRCNCEIGTLRAENETLRDWRRRTNECLDECRELAKEQGEWPLADEIGKLMAEAGQAEKDG